MLSNDSKGYSVLWVCAHTHIYLTASVLFSNDQVTDPPLFCVVVWIQKMGMLLLGQVDFVMFLPEHAIVLCYGKQVHCLPTVYNNMLWVTQLRIYPYAKLMCFSVPSFTVTWTSLSLVLVVVRFSIKLNIWRYSRNDVTRSSNESTMRVKITISKCTHMLDKHCHPYMHCTTVQCNTSRIINYHTCMYSCTCWGCTVNLA